MTIEAFGFDHDDAELAAFTRTSVDFATYHPTYRFEACQVSLAEDGATARCGLTVDSDLLGTISAGAVGEGAYDAVERASQLLEIEISRRIALREQVAEDAGPSPRPESARLPAPPAPVMVPAIWA